MLWPGFRYNFDGDRPAATFDTGNWLFIVNRPASISSNSMYNVMIFVRDAGCRNLSALRAKKTLPVSSSMTMAAYFDAYAGVLVHVSVRQITAVSQNTVRVAKHLTGTDEPLLVQLNAITACSASVDRENAQT